jgi:origin recognition complex subunit 3
VTARASAYEYAWSEQEKNLKHVLNEINSQTVEEIVEFVMATDPGGDSGRIPTGLITSGVSANVSHSTFTSIVDLIEDTEEILPISLAFSQCSSLKLALKAIIKNATKQDLIDDEEGELIHGRGGSRLLDYDLQILYEYMQARSLTRIVIYLENSESIDGSVLADIVDVLGSWQDRISFILLFEIATSIDLFQEKLTRSTLLRLQGTYFETKSAAETLERMFKAITEPDSCTSLYIGANVYKMLLDRQMEYVQNALTFVESLKYIYMQHYFVNATSCLLDKSEPSLRLQSEHCEDIRSLPSFRRYTETLIADKEKSRVKKLQNDDKYLEMEVRRMVRNGQEALRELHDALKVFETVQTSIPGKSNVPWSNLWLKAMSGDLDDSPTVRDLLLSVKKLPSDAMLEMLAAVHHIIPKNNDYFDARDFQHDINNLTRLLEDPAKPLRSEHDTNRETVRTTVAHQKVQLSKHKAVLSKEDAAYSAIVDRIHQSLGDFFTAHFIQPKKLPLHEIFLFDSKAAAREVFAPAPRQAIERALNAPHDYLDCDCCDGETGLSATQPPTAILYQLYLESGSLINISDLWSAFKTILEPEDGVGEEKEEQTLALFYRGLAELKYLGMIKNSRKKTDHLTKLAWKGL